jgi:hypothetical protein
MSDDANLTLETFEEGGSITAHKMRIAADSIEVPPRDDELLSPHRDDLGS